MTKPTLTWSAQQQAFLDWCRDGSGSCVLEAVAGAGKTTVLIAGGQVIRGQVAYMAYNRDIVNETKVKLADQGIDWKKMQANTAHGFGFAAYRKARPNVKVDEYKVRDLVDALIPKARREGSGWTQAHPMAVYQPAIVELVSLARQTAMGITGPVNDMHAWLEMAEHFDVFEEDDDQPVMPATKMAVVQLAQQVLGQSSALLDVIDFDDMIYMPLLHKCRFWQFDVIMVDEAQDTNAARRALVRAMLKRGGRVVAVGDRHQAIYGFTGADANSLDLISQDFGCIRLPLTISYRCPQQVVGFAQQWVSHIQAAPTAPQGSVSSSSMEDFLQRNDLNGSAAVLSRTNKPLVSLAFRLIRQRTPCKIEGRDVAARITKLIQRWKVTKLSSLEDKLDAYLARETTKLLAKKQESKLAEVEDAVETVRAIIDQCQLEKKTTVQDAIDYVESMFADNVSNVLRLSSIHKAKGREWATVFWLDRAGTCPNKWARQMWQQDQEVNLMYVAATRAKEQLIELAPPAKKEAA